MEAYVQKTAYLKSDLISVGFDDMNPVPLMFQTGYLSIESYDRETQVYTLRIPNREMEIGFYRNLLRLYDPRTNQQGSEFDYACRYAMEQRKVYLIGANFNESKPNRGLHFRIEEL